MGKKSSIETSQKVDNLSRFQSEVKKHDELPNTPKKETPLSIEDKTKVGDVPKKVAEIKPAIVAEKEVDREMPELPTVIKESAKKKESNKSPEVKGEPIAKKEVKIGDLSKAPKDIP